MKLLLVLLPAVCLISTLILGVESLRCHVCDNEECTNTTLVTCPVESTGCITITGVSLRDSTPVVRVNKNCTTLQTCLTQANTPTERSVNQGFERRAFKSMCCTSDCCNFPTLAVPNLLVNGKQCPSCASQADSQMGTCNTTVSCAGVEDTCFQGNATVNSTVVQRLGCMSRNLCSAQFALDLLLGSQANIICEAP